MIVAIPTMIALPIQRVCDPARLAEQRRGLGQEVEVELAEALVEDGAEHEREDEDGDERAEERDHRHELLDPAAATEVVRRAVMSYGSVISAALIRSTSSVPSGTCSRSSGRTRS